MPVPDFQTLMLPVLKHAAHGETRVPDVEAQIADEFELTQQSDAPERPTESAP
jgi:restriction system protein